MYLLANNIQREDKASAIYFRADKLMSLLNVRRDNLFYVDTTLTKLLGSTITHFNKDGFRAISPLFQTLAFEDNNRIKVIINIEIRQMFYDLVHNFSKLEYETLRNFKSVYSKTLYALVQKQLNLYRHTKFKKTKNKFLNFTYGLEELRDIFLGEKSTKYKALKDFKIKTLNIAIIEINKNNTFVLSYENSKAKRKVIGFNFQIIFRKNTTIRF
jgi:plasmid replication initiation protein